MSRHPRIVHSDSKRVQCLRHAAAFDSLIEDGDIEGEKEHSRTLERYNNCAHVSLFDQ